MAKYSIYFTKVMRQHSKFITVEADSKAAAIDKARDVVVWDPEDVETIDTMVDATLVEDDKIKVFDEKESIEDRAGPEDDEDFCSEGPLP